jgi:Retrotransposon gag protein
MARVNATTVRELMEKMEYIEVKVRQQIRGSSASSPNLRSTEGFGGPIHDRAEIRASGRIQGPKQEFSVFSGDDPDEWLAQCEYIFEMYETPEDQKVIQAVTNFRGEAGSWYKGYKLTREHPSWQHLMELVKIRFSKAEGVSSHEKLKNLVQP